MARGTLGAGVSSEQLVIRKTSGFRDAVLWNLGAEKAPTMADLGDGEWRKYVCVEAGAIGEPVRTGRAAAPRAEQP